ncbi:MAG: thymidine kinase [Pseudomonadota bacterium]|nr:thymidine kinase [Pseudomonadota bacterium]
MAKLYFYYSAMNAGKSTTLLQSAHNYQERGMDTLLFTPIIDDRYIKGVIKSRIGLEKKAIAFDNEYNFLEQVTLSMAKQPNLKCILVDEAQFLTSKQVIQLTDVVDLLKIPVLTYGIRTDFKANLFPGSMHLLAAADEIVEIKTICVCGRKATNNMRIDENGKPVSSGDQIEIGGNERYIALCRQCFKKSHSTKKSVAQQELIC